MIATLNGSVFVKTPTAVIIDVNGVGYEVLISGRTYDFLPEIGDSCFLFVQTVVREDAITLYGFSSKEEKEFFFVAGYCFRHRAEVGIDHSFRDRGT